MLGSKDPFDNLEEGECIEIEIEEMYGENFPNEIENKAKVCRISENKMSMDLPGEDRVVMSIRRYKREE